jgi:serine/threonine protein kinase
VPKVPDRIGQVIGQRYELLQVVGRGGQGMVYRANDQWLGRSIAIKVLGSKAARDPHMVERLMREQQAMSALRGTAAVELFDVCRGHQGELCLVMELLKGTDLDEHLYSIEQRNERLSLKRVAELFDPIVSTLETAHAAGILHRDLKPANIFLLETGEVRLLDFGMARLKKSAPLTAAGTVMGSPSFMAPEAWKGVSDLMDQRADVYSLGVILFRVLAGQLPFEGDSLKDKLIQTTTSPRPSLRKFRPDLPPAIDDWVATALAVDREARFGSVRALWNAFLETCDVEPPRRGRGSLWAAARGAVQRIVGSSRPAPPPVPESAPPPPEEPSFARDALAKSVFRISATPSDERVPEATMELRDDELLRIAPAPRKPPPPPPRVERTISITDADVTSVVDSDPAPKKPE